MDVVAGRVSGRRYAVPVGSTIRSCTYLHVNEYESTRSRVNAVARSPATDGELNHDADQLTEPNISDATLREHPLAVWVETRLGISFSDVDQRWVRARPRTVTEAVAGLSDESGRPPAVCRTNNRQDAALQAGHFNEQALLSVAGVIHDMPGIIELLADEAGGLRIVFDEKNVYRAGRHPSRNPGLRCRPVQPAGSPGGSRQHSFMTAWNGR